MEICSHNILDSYTIGDPYIQSEGGYFEIDQLSNGSSSYRASVWTSIDFMITDDLDNSQYGIIGNKGFGFGIHNKKLMYTCCAESFQTDIKLITNTRMTLITQSELYNYSGLLRVGNDVTNIIGHSTDTNNYFHVFHINWPIFSNNVCQYIKIYKITIHNDGSTKEYIPDIVNEEVVLKDSNGKVFHAIGGSIKYGREKMIRK